jgi:serine/threonine-protein kinase
VGEKARRSKPASAKSGAQTVAAALLARRHVRMGRGDRVGAQRLARYIMMVALIAWTLNADHVFDLADEVFLCIRGLSMVLLTGALVFVLYLALEPFVRRRWPEALISWARVLAGRWRDPLVGRDVLVGVVSAMMLLLLAAFAYRLPGWVGQAGAMPEPGDLDTLLGPRQIAASLLYMQFDVVSEALGVLLVVTLIRQVVRRTSWAAAIVAILLTVPPALFGSAPAWLLIGVNLLFNSVFLLVLVRNGLFAGMVAVYAIRVGLGFPVTMDLNSWAVTPTLWVEAVLLGLAVYGFRTATAGQAARPEEATLRSAA